MAPTLVASYKVSTGDTANQNTLTTPSFTPAVGELIVCKMGCEFPDSPTIGTLSSTGGLTFTTRDDFKATLRAPARIATAQVGASSSMTISCTFTTDTGRHFMLVERWSGATLDATPNLTSPDNGATSAPSTTLTTEAPGSVVTWVSVDYSASTGTRNYRSSATEIAWEQPGPGNGYSWYAAYQSAPTAGAQTLGMTAPSQTWTLLGLELQDASAAQTISPTGIPSAGAIGSPVVNVTASEQFISGAGGIPAPSSAAAFGFGAARFGENAFGAPMSGSIGIPTVSTLPPTQSVTPTGIPSGEAVGSPVVSLAAADQTVVAIGVGSSEAFGVPTVVADDLTPDVFPTGIDSSEAFGVPTVFVLPPELSVDDAGGIATAEAFGLPSVAIEIPSPGSYIRDTYFVDGIDLSTFAWRIETSEGLLVTPGTIGADPSLPGRDGVVQVFGGPGQQRRPDGLGTITFNCWLKGVDPVSGQVTVGSSTGEQWYKQWDFLVRLFHRRRLTLDHPRIDGTRRATDCYLLPGASIAPSRLPSSPWFGRFKVTFAIPGAHWVDMNPVTTGRVPLTTNGFLSLAAFADATAPCTDLNIVFGPGNNPRLTTSYNFVGWNGVIAFGRELGIRTESPTSAFTHQAGGAAWTPGHESLVYSPGPRLFEIDPSEPLSAVLTHTGGGSMDIEITGKRRYRTS